MPMHRGMSAAVRDRAVDRYLRETEGPLLSLAFVLPLAVAYELANRGYFGAAVVSARYGVTNARIALFRISCEPAPSTMFSGLAPCFLAIVSTRSPSFGELLNGSIRDRIGMGHENSLEWQRAHLRN